MTYSGAASRQILIWLTAGPEDALIIWSLLFIAGPESLARSRKTRMTNTTQEPTDKEAPKSGPEWGETPEISEFAPVVEPCEPEDEPGSSDCAR